MTRTSRNFRLAAASVAAALFASVLAVATATSPAAAAPVEVPAPAIRISEFSYQLRDFGEAEFVELTNVGTTPANLAGWSFDDVGAVVGKFTLSGSGVEPTARVDYKPASGMVTFLPGETEQVVVVTIHGDTIDEPGQAFGADWMGVVLSNPTNAASPSGPFAHVGFGLIVVDD